MSVKKPGFIPYLMASAAIATTGYAGCGESAADKRMRESRARMMQIAEEQHEKSQQRQAREINGDELVAFINKSILPALKSDMSKEPNMNKRKWLGVLAKHINNSMKVISEQYPVRKTKDKDQKAMNLEKQIASLELIADMVERSLLQKGLKEDSILKNGFYIDLMPYQTITMMRNGPIENKDGSTPKLIVELTSSTRTNLNDHASNGLLGFLKEQGLETDLDFDLMRYSNTVSTKGRYMPYSNAVILNHDTGADEHFIGKNGLTKEELEIMTLNNELMHLALEKAFPRKSNSDTFFNTAMIDGIRLRERLDAEEFLSDVASALSVDKFIRMQASAKYGYAFSDSMNLNSVAEVLSKKSDSRIDAESLASSNGKQISKLAISVYGEGNYDQFIADYRKALTRRAKTVIELFKINS